MPEIVERDGKFCLEGYGVADACYDSADEATAAQAKLTKAANVLQFTTPPNWMPDTPAQEEARFERLWSKVKERLGWKSDGDEATGFKVQGNHWLAVWSNDFKDRDGEIFTRKAIDAYVSRVDMGVTPLPELWVWHGGKETAIGSADWVGRHGHFVMAAGQFYGAAPAQAAKAYYSKHAARTGISHGFTYPADQFDGKHYGKFNTFEISLLPRGAEANWYTSLEGVKAMALDEKKLDYLKTVFDEEHATRILADWDKRGKALEELNAEYKDFVQPEGSEASADKQAVERAEKAFGDLMGELLESSSVPVEAALEAVKVAKATDAEVVSLKALVASLQAEVKAIREGAPRASLSKATEIETSHLSETLRKDLEEQDTVTHPVWGTKVPASSLQQTP